MARRSEAIEEEVEKPEKEKPDREKFGVTVDGEKLFRFRIFCATQNMTPSQVLQELITERLKGQKLPAGCRYVSRKRRRAMETSTAESEPGETG